MRMNVVGIKDEKRKNAKRIIIGGIRSTGSLQDIMTVIEGVIKCIGNVEIFKEDFTKKEDFARSNLMYTYTLKIDICDKEEKIEPEQKDLKAYEALINIIKDAGVELHLVMPREQGREMVQDAMKLYMEREKNMREAARKYSSEVKMGDDEVLTKVGSTTCKLDKDGLRSSMSVIDEGDVE